MVIIEPKVADFDKNIWKDRDVTDGCYCRAVMESWDTRKCCMTSMPVSCMKNLSVCQNEGERFCNEFVGSLHNTTWFIMICKSAPTFRI
jgi:hypothetical protein